MAAAHDADPLVVPLAVRVVGQARRGRRHAAEHAEPDQARGLPRTAPDVQHGRAGETPDGHLHQGRVQRMAEKHAVQQILHHAWTQDCVHASAKGVADGVEPLVVGDPIEDTGLLHGCRIPITPAVKQRLTPTADGYQSAVRGKRRDDETSAVPVGEV
nr:hypothetical protein [Kutzneria sp. 744]